MKRFENYNPAVTVAYFVLTCGTVMFSMNPVIAAISVLGAILYYIVRNGANGIKSHLFWLMMFIFMSLINPLFHHNGKTVLFMLNDNRVTLEALVYGIVSSGVIVSSVYWFRSFSQIMTSDKLLYVLGSVSPKFALLVSMALRYIPLFGKQAKRINSAQKALGLYKEDNAIDSIRGGTRVFSVLMTWALENGIITADSMTARGYGVAHRTHFSVFRFDRNDLSLLLVSFILSAAVWIPAAAGCLSFTYYPELSAVNTSAQAVAAYSCYAAICLIPTITEIGDSLKWHYLKSGI